MEIAGESHSRVWVVSTKGKGNTRAQKARYRANHPDRNKGDVAGQRKRNRKLHPERQARSRKRALAKRIDYPFLDGESWNDENGQARLVYLSCYSLKHQGYQRLANPKGLGTYECLLWMLKCLPSTPLKNTRQQHALIGWYFGGYDLTLILRDLPAWLHWLLLHPEKRRFHDLGEDTDKPACTHPIKWRGLHLDFMNNCFTLENDTTRVIIYDIARYYQCSFLKSLKDWKIGTPEELEAIAKGKAGRSEFSEEQFSEIKAYCDIETRLGSELWRKLREAHKQVGLAPFKWYGPGQTAKTLLTKVYENCYGTDLYGPGRGEVRWKRDIRHARLRIPKLAWPAFASAFFGGRFENSRYGVIEKPTFTGDIASAYPDALRHLPCLLHGAWRFISRPSFRELQKCALACVRYRLAPDPKRTALHWAPLPFRSADGSICYPVNSVGWAWLPEIEGARVLGFDPDLLEAWVFEKKCNCPVYRGSPAIRDLYAERIMLGKEGPGMVLKFALNSCYGVKAQVLGIHEARSLSPFQSFVEAGMITSLTRAKLLHAIAQSPKDCLMVNTDSVTSLRRLRLDETLSEAVGPDGKQKPELGAWEVEENEEGVTLIKQGIYFDREFKKLKARGIGRDVLQRNSKQIEKALVGWLAGETKHVELKENRDVFHGQRQCTQGPRSLDQNDWLTLAFNAAHGRVSAHEDEFKKRGYYGSWSKAKQKITFETLPKRERALKSGRLIVRDVEGGESLPYAKALAIAELVSEASTFEEVIQEWWLQDYPDFEEGFSE